MKKVLLAAMALLFLGATGMAMADEAAAPAGVAKAGKRTPGIKRRLHRQKNRIKQGVKSGELTKDETKELAADHKALREEVKDAKSDGTVTKDERKQIHKDLNAESKKIYDLKHNDTKQEGAK